MTHRALVYDPDDNMEVIAKPDLVKIVSHNYITTNLDINASPSGNIDFSVANYSTMSSYLSQVSGSEFVITKPGIYKIEFYLSAPANITAEVEISILKNNITTLAKTVVCSSRNAFLFTVSSLVIDDVITLAISRVGSDSSQILIEEKHSALIFCKIG